MTDNSDLTPAQEREARRKLRRAIGGDTPEEQAQRLVQKVVENIVHKRRKHPIMDALTDMMRAALKARKR